MIIGPPPKFHEIQDILVDDHIKRIYSKLGVRSRPELTATIFFDQHIPRIHHDVPVGGTGWFLR
jgi:hypothetical protein